jgi:membrane dipeptidase
MPIVDLHCDTLTKLEKDHQVLRSNALNLDLERMHKYGIILQDFAIFVRLSEYPNLDEAWEYTLKLCKFFDEQMSANKDLVLPVRSCKDIEKANRKRK